MADISTEVKQAFDEGRFLEIAQSAGKCILPEDRLMLGISLFKLGRSSDALDVLDALAAEAERLSKAFFYLALLYRRRGDDSTAAACIQKYLAMYPEDDEAHDFLESPDTQESFLREPSLQLAKIYSQQGHYEQALDIYAQVDQTTGLDRDAFREARMVQDMHILKTLQGWIEKVKQ